MSSVRWTERDPFGNSVQMTEERWRHVCLEHDDIATHEDGIRQTIRDPHVVYQSGTVDNELRFHRRTTGKRFILCVVIMTESPFVVSSHYVDKIKAKKGDRLLCMKM